MIKPCPFCGGKPNISKTSISYSGNCFVTEFTIKCSSCHVRFRANSKFEVDNEGRVKTINDGYKTIVDRWNKRCEEGER